MSDLVGLAEMSSRTVTWYGHATIAARWRDMVP